VTIQAPSPAHAYQDFFGPAIFEPLRAHVIELAAPRRAERVIDVACGTGIVTRALAERVGPGGRVVGVDLNPMMIEVARSLPAPAGAIEWREGDGTALDLPDAAFDLACCQQGLQFFPDRAAGAAELRRVLATGGRAVVAAWQGLDAHPLYAALADAEEPHLAALGVEITRAELTAPFSLGDAGALRALLTGAGFGEVEIATRTIQARFPGADRFVERMEHAYAAVMPRFAADPAAFQAYLDAIARDTRPIVESHRDGDDVVIPMHANIALARA
jgi:SAM-dependent methyltransferase